MFKTNEESEAIKQEFGQAGMGVTASGRIGDHIEWYYLDTEPGFKCVIESGSGHAIDVASLQRDLEMDRAIGIGVAEKVRSSVSTPVSTAAGATPAQPKSSGSPGALNAFGLCRVMRKLCSPLPPGMVAGVLGVPVSALVDELVVW